MPVIGFVSADGSSDLQEGKGHCSFDYALEEAATGNSDAFPYPYPVLKGMVDQNQKRDYISVTSVLHCLRAAFLKQRIDYYESPDKLYPMFRGTLFHALLESSPNPNARIEERHSRKHRGVELQGTFDSMLMFEDPDTHKTIIQDWKTTDNLPKYDTPYSSHIAQINLYRWLLGLDPKNVIMEVWYFSMQGMKRCRLKDGTQATRGGRYPINQHWSDKRIEDFLDDRLMKLKASFDTGIPMPYVMVPEEDKWECQYCPVAQKCESLRTKENEAVWRRENGLPPETTKEDIDPASSQAWDNVVGFYTSIASDETKSENSISLPVDDSSVVREPSKVTPEMMQKQTAHLRELGAQLGAIEKRRGRPPGSKNKEKND